MKPVVCDARKLQGLLGPPPMTAYDAGISGIRKSPEGHRQEAGSPESLISGRGGFPPSAKMPARP
jgi:hypothetical protein